MLERRSQGSNLVHLVRQLLELRHVHRLVGLEQLGTGKGGAGTAARLPIRLLIRGGGVHIRIFTTKALVTFSVQFLGPSLRLFVRSHFDPALLKHGVIKIGGATLSFGQSLIRLPIVANLFDIVEIEIILLPRIAQLHLLCVEELPAQLDQLWTLVFRGFFVVRRSLLLRQNVVQQLRKRVFCVFRDLLRILFVRLIRQLLRGRLMICETLLHHPGP